MAYGKSKYREISPERKQKSLEEFYEVISAIENKGDMKNFLKDLLTPTEALMIARRIEIAKLLLRGRLYEEVREELGVGFSTISYVDKWLNNGFGGYRKQIEEVRKNISAKKNNQDYCVDYMSFGGLKKRYPGHFALVDLIFGKKK